MEAHRSESTTRSASTGSGAMTYSMHPCSARDSTMPARLWAMKASRSVGATRNVPCTMIIRCVYTRWDDGAAFLGARRSLPRVSATWRHRREPARVTFDEAVVAPVSPALSCPASAVVSTAAAPEALADSPPAVDEPPTTVTAPLPLPAAMTGLRWPLAGAVVLGALSPALVVLSVDDAVAVDAWPAPLVPAAAGCWFAWAPRAADVLGALLMAASTEPPSTALMWVPDVNAGIAVAWAGQRPQWQTMCAPPAALAPAKSTPAAVLATRTASFTGVAP